LAYKYKESPFDYVLGKSRGSLQLVVMSGQFYFAHYNLILWKRGNELFMQNAIKWKWNRIEE
jgi:hypothetical protein